MGDHGPVIGSPTVAGDLARHRTRRPSDPGGDHLALESLGDPAGDLLTVDLG
jgi:hypothetical protein